MPRRPQPGLFDGAAIEQDRAGEESEEVYQLVTRLRLRGCVVHRAGAAHVVDGRKLSTREFIAFAEALLRLPVKPAAQS